MWQRTTWYTVLPITIAEDTPFAHASLWRIQPHDDNTLVQSAKVRHGFHGNLLRVVACHFWYSTKSSRLTTSAGRRAKAQRTRHDLAGPGREKQSCFVNCPAGFSAALVTDAASGAPGEKSAACIFHPRQGTSMACRFQYCRSAKKCLCNGVKSTICEPARPRVATGQMIRRVKTGLMKHHLPFRAPIRAGRETSRCLGRSDAAAFVNRTCRCRITA